MEIMISNGSQLTVQMAQESGVVATRWPENFPTRYPWKLAVRAFAVAA